jgi:transposase
MEEWVKKFKRKGIEIKNIGNRYYAYEVSSVWDKKLKRAKKVSGRYLGVVTPSGIMKPRTEPVPKGIYEYGNISVLYSLSTPLIKLLKEQFPYHWKRIACFSILRTILPLPLKSIKSHYEKTYLSVELPSLQLSPKSLSSLLEYLGENWLLRMRLMRSLTKEGGYVLFDLTAMMSRSKNNHWLEKGYNKDHSHLPQINVGLFYSLDSRLPTYVKLLPGSVRDVKSLISATKEAGIRNAVLILDSGFYSAPNLELLKRQKTGFIVPLKRNSKKIKHPKKWDDFLFYRKRHIKYHSYSSESYRVHIFEDAKLKYEEETTFYSLVEKGKRTLEELKENELRFGRIAILTNNKNLSSEDVYLMFKKREAIEYCFNAFKNLLEADKSYLRDKTMLDGYIFLNFLSLYLYCILLKRIKEKELSKKYSVRDILLELSKVYLVRYDKDKEITSEIPKKVRELVETLGNNLFPKIERS